MRQTFHQIYFKTVTEQISTYSDVVQKNPASPLILQTHQLLCMLALLFGLGVEELCKIWQGFIIPIKVVCLKETIKIKKSSLLCIIWIGQKRCTLHYRLYNISYHGEINIRGIELKVYLSVDGGLAVLVEVLSDLRRHFCVNYNKELMSEHISTTTVRQAVYQTCKQLIIANNRPGCVLELCRIMTQISRQRHFRSQLTSHHHRCHHLTHYYYH